MSDEPDLTDEEQQLAQRALARRRRKEEEDEERMIRESGGDENVMVCVRVRPFNRRELDLQKAAGESYIRSVIEMPEGMGGKVVCLEKNGDNYGVVEEFGYTKSFWSIAEDQQPYPFAPVTQEDVFEGVGMQVIKYAFAGFHNCVFAYGQTGSGKTHSMMGDFSVNGGTLDGVPGLIPLLCKELFDRISRRLEHPDKDIVRSIDVRLSAIEIYNEQVRDLFYRNTPGRSKNTVMKVRKHPTEGAFVDQLTVLNPTSWEQCIRLIEAGVQERTVAATLMNSESSRSHSVFQITITQKETIHVRSDDPNDRFSKPVTNTRISRINLVDLAGSERVKKSGAQGQNLKEAATINQSLSTLKKVIDALVTNGREPNPKKHIVIPFRESMLTMLLSHSLGGNSKTTMIACVSPHYDNQEETLLTLRYANRAKGIVNHTKVNEDDTAKRALQLKHEILSLQRRLEEGEDEEAEELKDQVEVGRLALREMEREQRRLETEAADLKSRTKQEEGARFAAAFYNSVKMAMLKEQKETLEASIQETEQRLARESTEVASLQQDLVDRETESTDTGKRLQRLQRDEHDHLMREMQQEQHQQQLHSDIHRAKKKLDHEVEMQYAQKLVNARRLRKQRDSNQQALERLQAEHDLALSAVILEAAENYERQVRKYADEDTHVQNRIRKADALIPKLIRQREEAELESARLQTVIRARDREHATRLDELESDWKQKYATMKADFEGRIASLEQQQYAEQRQWDEEIDDEDAATTAEHQTEVNRLESQVRMRETSWSGRVANRCADVADEMDKAVKKATEEASLKVAEARHRFERRVGAYVAHLRTLEIMCSDHDTAFENLSGQVAPLTRLYEDLKTLTLPSAASVEYRRLHSMLSEFSPAYTSTAAKATEASRHSDPFRSTDRTVGSPQRRSRGVALPPVAFYPTSPAK